MAKDSLVPSHALVCPRDFSHWIIIFWASRLVKFASLPTISISGAHQAKLHNLWLLWLSKAGVPFLELVPCVTGSFNKLLKPDFLNSILVHLWGAERLRPLFFQFRPSAKLN